MNDCVNAEMRDLLPDLLNDRLGVGARAAVEAHLAGCTDCRAELELLRQVRAAASAMKVPSIDASRLSANLPPYRRSAWRAASRSWQLRAAAAVVLLAGAASVLRDRLSQLPQPDTVLASAATAQGAELSVGGLTDIQDKDLQALLDGMAKLEAVTTAEPDVIVVPAVERGSGSQP